MPQNGWGQKERKKEKKVERKKKKDSKKLYSINSKSQWRRHESHRPMIKDLVIFFSVYKVNGQIFNILHIAAPLSVFLEKRGWLKKVPVDILCVYFTPVILLAVQIAATTKKQGERQMAWKKNNCIISMFTVLIFKAGKSNTDWSRSRSLFHSYLEGLLKHKFLGPVSQQL